MGVRRISLASSSNPGVAITPQLHFLQHLIRLDSTHSSRTVLHRDRIILSGLTVRIDDEVLESTVRPGALWVGVAHETDYRPVERYAHVQRTGIGREHQRRRIEN